MKRRSSEMAAFFCSRKVEILPFSVTLSITIFFCWLRQAQPTKKGFPLPSWLKFTGSFSFHFSKLSVKIIYENFATLDCFVPRNDRGIFVSVLNFENNRRSLRSRQSKLQKKINHLIKYFV